MNFLYFNETFYDECVNVKDICDKKVVSTAILIINCLSVLINILHLIVLSTILSLRSTKYFQVLMNCGASDAVASTVFAFITITCALEDTINRQSQHVISIANSAMAVIMLAASMLRTYVIGISSYERYISLCDPFNYETNKIVQNIGSFFAGCWVGCPVVMIILEIAFFKGTDQCFTSSGSGVQSAIETVIAFFLYFIPGVITIVCLFKVGLELRRMSRRAALPAGDDAVKTASEYVLFTSILFYFSYAIATIAILVKKYSNLTADQKEIGISVLNTYESLYNIFNVFVFIYLHPLYLRQVRKVVLCQGTAAVTPST